MGIYEGNKRDSLWELMKEIRGSCVAHDYTCWRRIVKLFSKAYLIGKYHPS
jgi:hypothetical protein